MARTNWSSAVPDDAARKETSVERELERGELEALEAITAFNLPIFQCRDEIYGLVQRHLGVDDAEVFAKPVLTGSSIVWTTRLNGTVRRWVSLGPAERASMEVTRQQVGQRIAALVRRLQQDGINTRSGNLAHLLESALIVPNFTHVFVVDNRPVLAFWGFRTPGGTGLDPLRSPLLAPTEPTSLPPWRWRIRFWIPALIGMLLLVAGVGWYTVSRPLEASRARSPPSSPLVEVSPPLPSELPKLNEPVAREPVTSRAETPPVEPAITAPKPLTLPTPPAEPTPAVLAHGTLMRMPENGDLASLQGCWRTDRYSYGSDPVAGYSVYCFDTQGHGHLTHTARGYHCDAPANVELKLDGTMYLADRDSTCSDGARWHQDRLHCKAGADGVAHCSGQGEGTGGIVRWSTTLRRQ
jgi:hypothetical protein